MGSRAIRVELVRPDAGEFIIAASDDEDMVEKLAKAISGGVALTITNSQGKRVVLAPRSILYAVED